MKVSRSVIGFLLVLLVGGTFSACGIFDDDDEEAEESVPFSIQIIPEHIEPSVPGQRCVFLVGVADEEGSGQGGKVTITATVTSEVFGTVTVEPQAIAPDEVAEVTVIPEEVDRGKSFTVVVRGERGGVERIEEATLEVVEGSEDELGAMAAEMRDQFIPWLAVNHPELGITSETEWIGTIVKPGILVVMYYLFFSEEWEMGVTWHVTRSPDNWTRIYLRHRLTEMRPSRGFEISSWSTEDEEPHGIDVEDPMYFMSEVWR